MLILDHWSSLLATNLDGTFRFYDVGVLHEIKIEYSAVKSNFTAQAMDSNILQREK